MSRVRRPETRAADTLRPIALELGVQRQAAGSVLISAGGTRVICAATIEEKVPPFLKDKGQGWVTAEYAMLPGSGDRRVARGPNARATEIQRLIARSLRAAVDLTAMPGLSITVDCDVLDADGGTRTASITGGWVALVLAVRSLQQRGLCTREPIVGQVAAVSVGVVDGLPLLDLDYLEDSAADVDMNVVALDGGRLVEVQGTAEKGTFDRPTLDRLLDLGTAGIAALHRLQRDALGQ